VVGVDPRPEDDLPAVAERIRAARFPVECHSLRADASPPFDTAAAAT
jgi:hypothetical protein